MTARSRTYLDWNATAPLRPEARVAMLAAWDDAGNPSSVHGEGRRARGLVERAREQVAALVGVLPGEVIFTSGATEANATVLAAGWDAIHATALEHDSVRVPAAALGHYQAVPVAQSGRVATPVAGPIATDNRALVIVQMANAETGVIQDFAMLADSAHAAGAHVHGDATQIAGRQPIAAEIESFHTLALSAHKLGGPQGVGALIVRNGSAFKPLLTGGGQEGRRRAGTENVAGIAGFGAAAAAALRDFGLWQQVQVLRDRLEQQVLRATPATVVLGKEGWRLPNTSCIALPGRSAETLVMQMDLMGIAVSAGSACSSGKVSASPVLAAMGIAPELARAAIRVSLGWTTTDGDIERFVQVWTELHGATRAPVAVPGARLKKTEGIQHARSA